MQCICQRKKKIRKMVRRRSLFSKAKSRVAAEHISIKNVSGARRSVVWLNKQLKLRNFPKTKLVMFANLASNRAKSFLRRRNLSVKERKEMRIVAQIYRRFVNKNKKR